MSLLHIHDPAVSQEMNNKPLKKRAIGIDLGTTHSLVAFADNGQVTVIPDEQGRTLVPSVVHYGENGLSVGYEALSYLATDPENTFYSFKRFMGQGREQAQKDQPGYRFLEESGIARLHTRRGPVSPVELSAEILRTLKNRAMSYLKTEIEHAVISIPAYFNETQRQATKNAAELAGLKVLRLLTEPTAAAIAYERQHDEEKIALYDLGGGTFDISVLQLRRGIFQVLAIGGDTKLGGDDIDQALLAHMISDHPHPLSPQDQIRLGHEVRSLKEQLSTVQELSYRLHYHTLDGQTLALEGRLTRETLAHLAQPILLKTLQLLQDTLKDAGLSTHDIDTLILVGGATRLPFLPDYLSPLFSHPPLTHLDPDKTVAIGAAMQADLLIGNRKEQHNTPQHPANAWLLLDVLPLSLGIETYGGIVEPIIRRNSPIPTMKSQQFTTFKDHQTGIDIHVLQGERDMACDCQSLARFQLSGIPPMKAGMAKIDIRFQIDADGLLSVSAEELNTHVRAEIMTMPSYGLTPEDIRKILKDSYEHADEDMRKRQLEGERVSARQLIDHLHSALEEDADLLSPEEQTALLSSMTRLTELLQTGDYDCLHEQVTALNTLSSTFSMARMNRALTKTLVGQRIPPSHT